MGVNQLGYHPIVTTILLMKESSQKPSIRMFLGAFWILGFDEMANKNVVFYLVEKVPKIDSRCWLS